MNLEIAQRKNLLFRRLKEQDSTYKHTSEENYNEFFTHEKLGKFKDILNEYENVKLLHFINQKNEFYKLIPHYTDKDLVIEEKMGYRLHFEFENVLFYELLTFHKEGIKKMINFLSVHFFTCYVSNDDAYYIPYIAYQDHFFQVIDDQTKNAAKFLDGITIFTVFPNDQMTKLVNIRMIRNYLSNLEKYYNPDL